MGAVHEVLIPDIGGIEGVEVVELLVESGDVVEAEQSLITLQSDKASMEVPTPVSGVVLALRVGVGDEVSEGHVVATIEGEAKPQPQAEQTPTAEPTPAPAPEREPWRPPPVVPQAPVGGRTVVHAGPGVRRFARELGVDLTQVRGTARKGRIQREDIEAFVRATLRGRPVASAAPGPRTVDFARFGPIDRVPLTRIQKVTGRNLQGSWSRVPMVTQHDLADITELEAFRRAHKAEAEARGFKLTFLAFLLKATAAALERHPRLKASLDSDGEHLVTKQYCHLGVAVDTPSGLVVPVIRDVDRKGLYALAEELGDVSARARAGKLTPGDLAGSVFTISSLGGIGGTAFTPLVNEPEVGILGVSRASNQPVWRDGAFEPRLMLPLALSYDHRVVDGALGARFTTTLSKLLGDLRQLLL